MKFLAIKKNMSLKDIVNEAMKEYLERTNSKQAWLPHLPTPETVAMRPFYPPAVSIGRIPPL